MSSKGERFNGGYLFDAACCRKYNTSDSPAIRGVVMTDEQPSPSPVVPFPVRVFPVLLVRVIVTQASDVFPGKPSSCLFPHAATTPIRSG